MIPSQMLKGTLEGCILKVIGQSETYGYEISQRLKTYGFSDIAEGTIYPLLLRLEKSGLIEAVYRQSTSGPNRKYFHLTKEGQKELLRFSGNWSELKTAVDAVLGGLQHE
ncbi:MAG: PadR family transcriptional regulator [Oscillibacter ruminantium]|uniref:PadR family transcriptional regulator n=1 Tax=Oscillibacter ruminantium TaxID=1263547 RepID=UPI002B1FE5B9|nr:PadR family transcriptional regulator [Oscillibacter ruminantium]MEA5041526.1 PadR family transcriptional regulator [Oscillibacter ruminantium]